MFDSARFSWGAAALASSLLFPAVARADLLWKGDFETGDLKQWSYLLNEAGLSVVDMPVAEGKHSGRVQITKDNLWSNGLNRVEMQYAPSKNNTAGTEIYFGYSVYVPELLTTDSHQIGYWETTSTYQQLFHVAVMGSRVALRTQKPSYKEQWAADGLMTPGVWHRLVMHVAWSTDPAKGMIDLWWDGVQRVTALKVQTYLDNPPFTQLGILRDTIDKVETLYVDDARAGTTYDDVKGSVSSGGGTGGTGGASAGGAGGGSGSSTGGTSAAGTGSSSGGSASAGKAGASSGGAPATGGGAATGGAVASTGGTTSGGATSGGATSGGATSGGVPAAMSGGSASTTGGTTGMPTASGGQPVASQPKEDASCSIAAPGSASGARWALLAVLGLLGIGRRVRRSVTT